MLRDKFLLQIQTDKSCTEEGKKVIAVHDRGVMVRGIAAASAGRALSTWIGFVLRLRSGLLPLPVKSCYLLHVGLLSWCLVTEDKARHVGVALPPSVRDLFAAQAITPQQIKKSPEACA